MKTPAHILVVEDDVDLRELESELLRSAGYRVSEAGNGLEALAQLAADMPRVILLDMLMPGMDGWEFARRFHEQYAGAAPIIVVTAAEHAGARAAEVRAAAVIAKPFKLSLMLLAVERVLTQPQAAAQSQ